MKITFLGATRTVTGSQHLVETAGARVLVDCGMFQGEPELEARNRLPFPFPPAALDALVLTHAHTDHAGLVPRLVREGFAGKIWATGATAQVAAVQLLDLATAHHEEGREAPLFDAADVERAYARMSPVPYGRPAEIAPGVRATLRDAGHILGSAFVELELEGRRVVFSGDLGPPGKPIVRDPETAGPADVVVLESTYGDREHRTAGATLDELSNVLVRAAADGGVVLIPAFALGRCQEMLYALAQLAGRPGFPRFRVYLDSPLAIRFTELYRRHPEHFDDETSRILASGRSPFEPPDLTLVKSHRESLGLADLADGGLIVSPAGMCTGGRILRHLATYAPRPTTDLVFASWQGKGTPGRKIVDGAKFVEIDGRRVPIRCHVHTLGGFSGHAGRADLTRWARSAVQPGRTRLYLVHGDLEVMRSFAGHLQTELGIEARLPAWRQSVEI